MVKQGSLIAHGHNSRLDLRRVTNALDNKEKNMEEGR